MNQCVPGPLIFTIEGCSAISNTACRAMSHKGLGYPMKRSLPYIIFALVYVTLELIVAFLRDWMFPDVVFVDSLEGKLYMAYEPITTIFAAFLAVYAGRVAGDLSLRGVLTTSVGLYAGLVAVAGILLSRSLGEGWLASYMDAQYSWLLLLNMAVFLASPYIWLLMVNMNTRPSSRHQSV